MKMAPIARTSVEMIIGTRTLASIIIIHHPMAILMDGTIHGHIPIIIHGIVERPIGFIPPTTTVRIMDITDMAGMAVTDMDTVTDMAITVTDTEMITALLDQNAA